MECTTMCVCVRACVCVCIYMCVCVCVCLCNKGPRGFVCQEIFTASWQQQLMKHLWQRRPEN